MKAWVVIDISKLKLDIRLSIAGPPTHLKIQNEPRRQTWPKHLQKKICLNIRTEAIFDSADEVPGGNLHAKRILSLRIKGRQGNHRGAGLDWIRPRRAYHFPSPGDYRP